MRTRARQRWPPEQRIIFPVAAVRPSLCTHLPDLLAHNGEHPEVEHVLGDGGTRGRLPLEVHQQHVGEQQEEEEVHENVAQKRGHGREPELSPS